MAEPSHEEMAMPKTVVAAVAVVAVVVVGLGGNTEPLPTHRLREEASAADAVEIPHPPRMNLARCRIGWRNGVDCGVVGHAPSRSIVELHSLPIACTIR